MAAFLVDIFLLAGIHYMIKSKFFLLVILSFDVDACVISLFQNNFTSRISSISL